MEETGTGEGAAGQVKTAEEDPADAANEAAFETGSWRAVLCRTPLVCSAAGLDRDTFKICKEFLRPFKKSLRKLHLPQHLPKEKKVKYMKEGLAVIGDRIDMFLQQHCRASEVSYWKKMLWRFVSLFSEMNRRQLQKLYEYIKSNRMDKFQLLCCHSENAASAPGRNPKQTNWGSPTAAEDSAELQATRRDSPGADTATANTPGRSPPRSEDDS